MNIGIDASRAARAQRTGTENYSRHLINHLVAVAADWPRQHRFTLYFNEAPAPGLLPQGPGCQWRVMPWPRLWTHLRLSVEMRRHPPDVLFVPAHVLPLLHPRRSVVTVHDLGYRLFPEAYRPAELFYLRLSTWFSARWATHLLADSDATRQDLMRYLGVTADTITVIYPGVDESFAFPGDPQRLAQVRARYGLPQEYLLHLGTIKRRKNITRLLAAYRKLRGEGLKMPLVLAGRSDDLGALLPRGGQHELEGVIFTGFLAEEDVPALLQGALAMVIPSLFEGFGLPALEALASGTPVVAANTSSLPEVVGEAGVLVNPLSVDDIARGIAQVVGDAQLRAELRQRGLARAQLFTWERAARDALEVLERVGAST